MMRGKQSRYNTASIEWVFREGLSDKMTAMLTFIDKESSYKDQEEKLSRQMEQHVQSLEDRNKCGQCKEEKGKKDQ